MSFQLDRSEWSAHWRVPVVSALALAVSVIPIYSLGALMVAIHADTGWTRSQISIGPTLVSFFTVLLAPLVGIAIDRYGSRRVGLPGIVFYCIAVASISLAGAHLYNWWLVWSLVAVAYATVKMTVWTAAVVNLFERSRGLALGVTLAGLGIGSSCLPFLTTVLQERFGWRAAYIALAAGGFVIVFPLLFFFFNDGGVRRPPHKEVTSTSWPSGTSAREAFLSRRYLQMAIACLSAAIPSTAFVVHFVPIVRSFGLSPRTAAATAGAIGITSILGRLGGGFLLDRYSATMIGCVACALPVASGPLLLINHGVVAAVFAASMIGLSAGAEIAVLAYLLPRFFGLQQFGLLFGVLNALITLGLGLGPFFAAWLFDHYKSYNHFLLLTVPPFALSAILLGTLGKPTVEPYARSFAPKPSLT